MVRQVWSAHVSPLVSLRRALFRVRRTILISMSNVIFAAEAEMTPGVRQFFGERRLRVLIRPRPANSNRAAELQRQADEAKSSGNLKKAIRLYSRALAHTPHNAALFFLRGSALFEANRPGDAARDFVAGLKLDPGNQTLTFLLLTANARAAEQSVAPQAYRESHRSLFRA
jgi:predicted Zn-dependent protease